MNLPIGMCPRLAIWFGAFGLSVIAAAAESGPAPSQPAALENSEWMLTEMNGKALQAAADSPRRLPMLRFDAAKKQATGFSGVNRFSGSYERAADKLKFGPLTSTRMAGPPEAMELEKDFLALLGNVTHFRISDGELEVLQDGRVIGQFNAAPAKALSD